MPEEDKMLQGVLLCEPCGTCKVFVQKRDDGTLVLVAQVGEAIEKCQVDGAGLLVHTEAGVLEHLIIGYEASTLDNAINVRVFQGSPSATIP